MQTATPEDHTKEYTPFGEEWQNEMSKCNKSILIQMFKNSQLEKRAKCIELGIRNVDIMQLNVRISQLERENRELKLLVNLSK